MNDSTNNMADAASQALYNNFTVANQFIGLPGAVDDGTNLVTYGNINRTTNPWWQSKRYAAGSASRLAILLTDTDSAWLGLAHGLEAIGIPFLITRDAAEAVRHRVVFVYPEVSGTVLPGEALRALVGTAAAPAATPRPGPNPRPRSCGAPDARRG